MNAFEPNIVSPESEFGRVVVAASENILRAGGISFITVPKFGLDVAFFAGSMTGITLKMLEFKCFVGGRPDGVGFGSSKGLGPQVDLLRSSASALDLVAPFVRWVLVDALLPSGTKRYALFDSNTAKAAAMGEVKAGKQNNFRVSALRPHMVEWSEFLLMLEQFLKM